MTWPAGTHGSTFGGNPVSCAAALATIDLVESGLADAAAERGAQLLAGVQALMARQPLVEAVRGRGLMIGLDLADHDVAVALEQECFRRGLLVLTCGERSVRLAPPLVIRAGPGGHRGRVAGGRGRRRRRGGVVAGPLRRPS